MGRQWTRGYGAGAPMSTSCPQPVGRSTGPAGRRRVVPQPGRLSVPEKGTAMRAKDALGAYGEQVAARHLEEAGCVLLDRNWRCSEGEIDLVASDGAVLVICEVKTRSSLAYGDPAEAVVGAKAARLRRLAVRWMA